jgi:MATE family multidrug resistance protein
MQAISKIKYPAKITKKYLFILSIPIFFSNLALPMVGLVDTALVGHLENSQFLAATSVATSIITMIFWSFGFLRMGTTGLVSQSLGKGDYREIVLTAFRNLTFAVFAGIIILLSKYPILNLIKYYFKTSEQTYFLISEYISVRLFSAPAELSIYVIVGLFIGLQKTKISSFIIIFFSLTNILLSIYFVKVLNLNIYGVALGTVLSSYLSVFIFIIYTYYFIQKEFNIIPRYKKIFITKKIIKLFNINFDIFLRTLLLTFSFLWFTYQSSKINEDFLAVNSILLQFIVLASFFLDSYAHATEGVVGFSMGRKIKKSFLLAVQNSFILSFTTGLIISFLYLLFFKEIINTLTDIDYLRFLSYGYLFWLVIIPPIASICYQYDGIFIGTAHTAQMRNAMLVSVSLYIFISIFLTENFSNHGLWFSLLVFMILRSLTLKFYFPDILRKF